MVGLFEYIYIYMFVCLSLRVCFSVLRTCMYVCVVCMRAWLFACWLRLCVCLCMKAMVTFVCDCFVVLSCFLGKFDACFVLLGVCACAWFGVA